MVNTPAILEVLSMKAELF